MFDSNRYSYLDLFGVGILLYCAERAWRSEFAGLNLWPALFCVAVAITILAGTSVWAKRSGIDWQNAHDTVFMIVAPVLTRIAFALIWAARDDLSCRIWRYFAGAGCSGRWSDGIGLHPVLSWR